MSKSYNYIMREWLYHSDCSLYALVDGLQFERHFRYELETSNYECYPFFDTYPDSKIAFAGPWIFKLNSSEVYRAKLAELETKYPSVSWLLSPLDPETLLLRFKNFSTIELPNGKCALFRFYDPRVLKNLTFWLGVSDCFRLIQDMRNWVFTVDDEVFDLKIEVDKHPFD